MDAAPKLFGSVAIIIVLLGLFVGFNQNKAKNLNSKERPFLSKVVWENTLCSGRRECFQELMFTVDDQRVTLYSRQQPFYKVGDSVELIKVYKPPLGPPMCGKAANCSGIDLRETYKLYIQK